MEHDDLNFEIFETFLIVVTIVIYSQMTFKGILKLTKRQMLGLNIVAYNWHGQWGKGNTYRLLLLG